MSGSMTDDLVAIARIARPHGLRGELIADMLTDFPDRFDDLDHVIAVDGSKVRRELTLESWRPHQDRILLKFEGVDRIEDAEPLRSAEICVTEEQAVELEEDEFFDWQLAGCRVETVDGEEIGIVTDLMRTGGTENLVVAGEKEYLIPFAEAICIKVDVEAKRIVIDPPDGLLEF